MRYSLDYPFTIQTVHLLFYRFLQCKWNCTWLKNFGLVPGFTTRVALNSCMVPTSFRKISVYSYSINSRENGCPLTLQLLDFSNLDKWIAANYGQVMWDNYPAQHVPYVCHCSHHPSLSSHLQMEVVQRVCTEM